MTDPAHSYLLAVKPLKFEKEEKAPSSLSENSNGSNHERSTEALRALVAELRAEGIADPNELLRWFAVNGGRRVLAAFRADPLKGRRWLETVLRDGASMLREPGPPMSELDRQRIQSVAALYERSTGQEWER